MIYDDQPPMIQAVMDEKQRGALGARNMIEAAFAAIDREALIEKVYTDRRARGYAGPEDFLRLQIEKDFAAAGILPERTP